MKLTKEDKEMLTNEYKKVWSTWRMVDYCVKKASAYVEFDGMLVVFDKPTIETDFWFAEHTYDYEEVCELCDSMSNDEQYFIAENIRNCRASEIVELIDNGELTACICPKRYYTQQTDCRLGYIEWCRHWEAVPEVARPLTDDEIAALRQICVEEVEKFQKRLQTYLKRYGLTKCHYGVYWADR